MKLIVNTKSLLKALSKVGRVASNRSVQPMLSYVKIEARTNGTIVTSASDNELSVMYKFMNEPCSEAMEFCINPRDFVGVLKSINDEVITLEVDTLKCEIIHSKGTITLPIMSAVDFPSISLEKEVEEIINPTGELIDWFNNALHFNTFDPLRPILNGVNLYINNGEFGVCASDGKRLFNDYKTIDSKEGIVAGGTVQTKAIAPLLDLMDGEETVLINFGKQKFGFKTKTCLITCVKPEGQYPNIKRLIARKEKPIVVCVKKDELIDTLQRSNLMSSSSKCLSFTISEHSIMVDGENLDFAKKSHEIIECESNGEITIGLHGEYLLDILSAVSSDTVRMEISGATDSVSLYDDNATNKSIIIMPMMIQS